MIGRWGLYQDVKRDLQAAGFSLDEADRAAKIAERAVRERRDQMIIAAVRSGMPTRAVAALWGMHHTNVIKIARNSEVGRAAA